MKKEVSLKQVVKNLKIDTRADKKDPTDDTDMRGISASGFSYDNYFARNREILDFLGLISGREIPKSANQYMDWAPSDIYVRDEVLVNGKWDITAIPLTHAMLLGVLNGKAKSIYSKVSTF